MRIVSPKKSLRRTMMQAWIDQKYADVIDKFAEANDMSRAACLKEILENVARDITTGRVKAG